MKFEALQEIKANIINNSLNSYITFCKYNYKNDKNRQINNLKNYLKTTSKILSFDNDTLKRIQNISGIITEENNIKNLIEKLPKYSFTVWVKFKLLEPYFSRDDDEFYIIQNPILKETVFKVPMVRGSSWKGALAGTFKKLLNNNSEKSKIIESYLRIFGAGSESIKEIESYLREKSSSLKEFKDKVLEFMLFELGMEIKKEDIDEIKNEDDELKLIQKLKSKISNKLEKSQLNLPPEFQTHKGRAIFYPTYFDKISLEIINPHDRRKRAGIVPIHYEVVPKDTEGILQIVYIPFDGVLKKDKDLKEEVEQDLKYLCQAIKTLADEGIGAKTKLGWGRFEMLEGIYCINSEEHFDVKGWERCQT
jgi:CRISPR-associated protein Cmr2